MSEHYSPTRPASERIAPGEGTFETVLLVVAAIALLLSAVGAFFQPKQFAHSWLFAFMYFYTIAIGAFFWTILHHAVDADWTVLVRRQFENIAALFPYLFIAFLPLLFVRGQLWSWMRPEVAAEDSLRR